MRLWAIEQLAATGSDEKVDTLLGALDSDDPEVLRLVIRTLAQEDDPRVLPALRPFTTHDEARVRRAAEVAVERLQ